MNDAMVTKHTKHTPGPWYVPDQRDCIVEFVNEETGYKIAIANCGESYVLDDAEMCANAALIAAAPELLEALRVLVDHTQEQYPHFESERGQRDIAQALAAIAKAVQS